MKTSKDWIQLQAEQKNEDVDYLKRGEACSLSQITSKIFELSERQNPPVEQITKLLKTTDTMIENLISKISTSRNDQLPSVIVQPIRWRFCKACFVTKQLMHNHMQIRHPDQTLNLIGEEQLKDALQELLSIDLKETLQTDKILTFRVRFQKLLDQIFADNRSHSPIFVSEQSESDYDLDTNLSPRHDRKQSVPSLLFTEEKTRWTEEEHQYKLSGHSEGPKIVWVETLEEEWASGDPTLLAEYSDEKAITHKIYLHTPNESINSLESMDLDTEVPPEPKINHAQNLKQLQKMSKRPLMMEVYNKVKNSSKYQQSTFKTPPQEALCFQGLQKQELKNQTQSRPKAPQLSSTVPSTMQSPKLTETTPNVTKSNFWKAVAHKTAQELGQSTTKQANDTKNTTNSPEIFNSPPISSDEETDTGNDTHQASKLCTAPSFDMRPLFTIDSMDSPPLSSIESLEIIKTDTKPPKHSLSGTQATRSSTYNTQPQSPLKSSSARKYSDEKARDEFAVNYAAVTQQIETEPQPTLKPFYQHDTFSDKSFDDCEVLEEESSQKEVLPEPTIKPEYFSNLMTPKTVLKGIMKFSNSSRDSLNKLDDPIRSEDIRIDNQVYRLADKPPSKVTSGWGKLFDKKANVEKKADSSKNSDCKSDVSSSGKDVGQDSDVDRQDESPSPKRNSGWGKLFAKNSSPDSVATSSLKSSGLSSGVLSSPKDVRFDPSVEKQQAVSASKLNASLRKIYDKKNTYGIVVNQVDPPSPGGIQVPPLGVKKQLRIDTSHEEEKKPKSKSKWRLNKIHDKRRKTVKQATALIEPISPLQPSFQQWARDLGIVPNVYGQNAAPGNTFNASLRKIYERNKSRSTISEISYISYRKMDAIEGAKDLGIDPDSDSRYMYIAKRYAKEGNIERLRYYKKVFSKAKELDKKISEKIYKLDHETYEKMTCSTQHLLLEGITVRYQPQYDGVLERLKIDDELQSKLQAIEITPKAILDQQEYRKSLCQLDPQYKDVQEQILHSLNTFNTKTSHLVTRRKEFKDPTIKLDLPPPVPQVKIEEESGFSSVKSRLLNVLKIGGESKNLLTNLFS